MADRSPSGARMPLRELWFQPMGFHLRVLTNHPAIAAGSIR